MSWQIKPVMCQDEHEQPFRVEQDTSSGGCIHSIHCLRPGSQSANHPINCYLLKPESAEVALSVQGYHAQRHCEDCQINNPCSELSIHNCVHKAGYKHLLA